LAGVDQVLGVARPDQVGRWLVLAAAEADQLLQAEDWVWLQACLELSVVLVGLWRI